MSTLQTVSFSTILACTSIAFAGWEQLAPIPDPLGVAAPFAGVSANTLLVAGGSNFPDKEPWDGGKKTWYDTIYAMDAKTGIWKTAGKLPRPLGYGVSVTWHDQMICVGGNDASRCYADAFAVRLKNGRTEITPLPSLPAPLTNASGVCVNDTLYITAGQSAVDSTQALQSVYQLDLSDAKANWKTVPPIPGPGRILATTAAFEGAFYVMGGAALSESPQHTAQRKYLADVYRYAPQTGWKQLKDLPNPIVAAPTPAPVDDSGFFILGGDDGSHVGITPTKHPGFSKTILHYNARSGTWTDAGETPAARVTVPCVPWHDGWAITCGEMRPGVRSNQVWVFNPASPR